VPREFLGLTCVPQVTLAPFLRRFFSHPAQPRLMIPFTIREWGIGSGCMMRRRRNFSVCERKFFGRPAGRIPRATATALRRFLFESLRREAPHAGAYGDFFTPSGT
jgi:hypothetical protein